MSYHSTSFLSNTFTRKPAWRYSHLIAALSRPDADLVMLILTFLKSMSVYQESVDEMVGGGGGFLFSLFLPFFLSSFLPFFLFFFLSFFLSPFQLASIWSGILSNYKRFRASMVVWTASAWYFPLFSWQRWFWVWWCISSNISLMRYLCFF